MTSDHLWLTLKTDCFTQMQFELHSNVCTNASGGIAGGLQCSQLHVSDGALTMEGESLLKYLVGFEVVVVGVPPELRVQGSVNQGAIPKQGGAAPQNISCKEV